MTKISSPLSIALFSVIVLAGCISRPAPDAIRYFLLSSSEAGEKTAVQSNSAAIIVGTVKMPSYLLRKAVAIRVTDNEMKYFEFACWGERLDENFKSLLTATLKQSVTPQNPGPVAEQRTQIIKVFVDISQFDVDIHGRGILMADWRIGSDKSEATLKTNHCRLIRTVPSSPITPGLVAETLSELTVEFSKVVAQSISKTATPN